MRTANIMSNEEYKKIRTAFDKAKRAANIVLTQEEVIQKILGEPDKLGLNDQIGNAFWTNVDLDDILNELDVEVIG